MQRDSRLVPGSSYTPWHKLVPGSFVPPPSSTLHWRHMDGLSHLRSLSRILLPIRPFLFSPNSPTVLLAGKDLAVSTRFFMPETKEPIWKLLNFLWRLCRLWFRKHSETFDLWPSAPWVKWTKVKADLWSLRTQNKVIKIAQRLKIESSFIIKIVWEIGIISFRKKVEIIQRKKFIFGQQNF